MYKENPARIYFDQDRVPINFQWFIDFLKKKNDWLFNNSLISRKMIFFLELSFSKKMNFTKKGLIS